MKKQICYLAGVLLIAACHSAPKELPILGPREAVQKTVNGKTVTDTVYQTIPAFKFLNQDSAMIDNHTFDGKIYVADFFFTSCPTICPVMHRNLLKVYEKYKGHQEVMLLSHSIDFKYDIPHVLKKYADKLGITGTQWEFVHGSKEAVYTLAQKNYLVSVAQDAGQPGGYVHQGYLVLIDKEKRVRGAYDGTDEKQVEQMMKDMDTLLSAYTH
ncbi:SCO family protein [Mucilaginibacter paludis]|uniref:Electron transport protein SCO1/SenC n=1 Tax=Mucilaginibacter paludis DSM 18603 TaxID=714943 RepID=H1Y858_9SPHI|nr:SCO family protein [Mucilaginibacter paludis]EHQ31080.1 electron transport protein SCO1/SenC [Mucilaginibacter paludis DSM 18603]